MEKNIEGDDYLDIIRTSLMTGIREMGNSLQLESTQTELSAWRTLDPCTMGVKEIGNWSQLESTWPELFKE